MNKLCRKIILKTDLKKIKSLWALDLNVDRKKIFVGELRLKGENQAPQYEVIVGNVRIEDKNNVDLSAIKCVLGNVFIKNCNNLNMNKTENIDGVLVVNNCKTANFEHLEQADMIFLRNSNISSFRRLNISPKNLYNNNSQIGEFSPYFLYQQREEKEM